MRKAIALGIVTGSLCFAAGCGSGAAQPLSVARVHLRPAPGWHVGSTPAQACIGGNRRRCVHAEGWASTVRYRDCPICVAPHSTIAALPPNGIIIQLSSSRERPAYEDHGSWPPKLRASQVHAGFEGVEDKYGVIQTSGQTEDGVNHSLYVWFGNAHPSARQLARANAELASAASA
jgi:hypothetical protein